MVKAKLWQALAFDCAECKTPLARLAKDLEYGTSPHVSLTEKVYHGEAICEVCRHTNYVYARP